MPAKSDAQRNEAARARYWRNPERARAASRAWKLRNKEHLRKYARLNSVRHVYGLSFEQYERLKQEQNNLCAICRRPQNRQGGKQELDVDHDHQTGKVRGLLCNRCNRLLALLENSPKEIVGLAEEYLARHK